jgi:hypothetical protein
MTENRYEAPLSNVSPSGVQASYLKSWALFFLLSSVGGALTGAIAGGVVGAVLGGSGVPISSIRIATGIVGFVAALPISYLAFRWSAAKYLVAPSLLRGNALSPDRHA